MEIRHILAFASIMVFFIYLLLSKDANRSYLRFILLFLPFMDLNLTPEQFGSISVFDFISWFTFFFTIRRFTNLPKKKDIYYSLFTALLILLFLGSITSQFIENSIFNLLKIISIFIYSKILIKECSNNPEFKKSIFKYLKLGALFSLIFLLIQLIPGKLITFYPDINPNIYADNNAIRYPSYFQDPQTYAQYLAMLSFLFLMNKERPQINKVLNVIAFVLMALAILVTGSRLAFFGMCGGLLIITFSTNGKYKFPIILGCLLAYFSLLNFSDYFSFFKRSDDYKSSLDTRNQIWKDDLNIFYSNPLLGIGIGNHHNYIVKHTDGGYYTINNEIVYFGTENGYLQILLEYGTLGFILSLLLIITPIVNAIHSYRRSKEFSYIILIASILSWVIAYITVNSLNDKRVLVVLATLLSLLIISKNKPALTHG